MSSHISNRWNDKTFIASFTFSILEIKQEQNIRLRNEPVIYDVAAPEVI